MDALFLWLFNRGVVASWVVLAVLLIRLLFKKAPKWALCILWALVAVRLLIPELPQAVFSWLPSSELLPTEALLSNSPTVNSGIPIVDEAINHANRKTVGHFFDILFAKRYDEEDMIILSEKDFV